MRSIDRRPRNAMVDNNPRFWRDKNKYNQVKSLRIRIMDKPTLVPPNRVVKLTSWGRYLSPSASVSVLNLASASPAASSLTGRARGRKIVARGAPTPYSLRILMIVDKTETAKIQRLESDKNSRDGIAIPSHLGG